MVDTPRNKRRKRRGVKVSNYEDTQRLIVFLDSVMLEIKEELSQIVEAIHEQNRLYKRHQTSIPSSPTESLRPLQLPNDPTWNWVNNVSYPGSPVIFKEINACGQAVWSNYVSGYSGSPIVSNVPVSVCGNMWTSGNTNSTSGTSRKIEVSGYPFAVSGYP